MTRDCGHDVIPQGIGTGYATEASTGRKICYACADSAQAAELATSDKIVAYISGDGENVTTWSGGVLMRVRWHNSARNGWHGSMIHFWRATDADGRRWYGRNGGECMSITMRKAHV